MGQSKDIEKTVAAKQAETGFIDPDQKIHHLPESVTLYRGGIALLFDLSQYASSQALHDQGHFAVETARWTACCRSFSLPTFEREISG
jgi:hypothetical protein